MPQVILQIGFGNFAKETQRISALHNGEKVTWVRGVEGYNGNFTTPTSRRTQVIWFLAKVECNDGDVIALKTEVFLRGQGFDESRSRVIEWLVDSNISPPTEFHIRKVGDSHFPLAYGPLNQILDRARIDDRRDEAHQLYDNSNS